MYDMDKMVEKISNLLDLANNNPNEHETLAAALKAQELMAKYHIELADLDHDAGVEIVEEVCSVDESGQSMWKVKLANIIAENFCCKVYHKEERGIFTRTTRNYVVFYGYEHDAKIAKEVFTVLFNTGIKLARHEYYIAKNSGKYTKYVMNTYLMGFCEGIRDVLAKQCTALMVVTPKEVIDSYKEMSQGFKTQKSRVTIGSDSGIYERGIRDGKDVANARSIEKAV